jgi:hypothetical protein
MTQPTVPVTGPQPTIAVDTVISAPVVGAISVASPPVGGQAQPPQKANVLQILKQYLKKVWAFVQTRTGSAVCAFIVAFVGLWVSKADIVSRRESVDGPSSVVPGYVFTNSLLVAAAVYIAHEHF